jgi:hypothetical protein
MDKTIRFTTAAACVLFLALDTLPGRPAGEGDGLSVRK